MAVKDFMTKKVVYVSPDTTVAHVADMMREQNLRRLPVVENDNIVGIVAERTIAEASPSKATTLSIYEMNYLLNKTKIRDIMIQNVVTVSPYASLEDAIYIMMKNRVGILPVVENGQIYGIITDKDVFKAFLEVSGYGERGIRVVILANDTVGTLAKIVDTISDDNLNIKRIVVATRQPEKVIIEIQIEGKTNLEDLRQKLVAKDIHVASIDLTEAKSLD